MATQGMYQLEKHTATKADVCTGTCVVYAVQIQANGANADIELTNATTDTNANEVMYSVLDGDTILFDYSDLGGITFTTGLTLTVAGSGAVILIWTDKNQAQA